MPKSKFNYIGKSLSRVDALSKVTGEALYPNDLTRPGMLHLKILFAGRPHARIVSLDTSQARALPGVVAVLTAKDVPVNQQGYILVDQEVLCSEVVRYEGDQVAVVIAETEKIASRARDLIKVVYQNLPAVCDPREAMKPEHPLVHSERATNILKHIPIRKGNLSEGFQQADVIVSGSYYLPMQEHAFLQTEAGLAYMDGEQIVVETAGQSAHHEQRQIARAMGLTEDKVRVIYRAIGGAFGGREDISVQIVLALAARKTGRPVKIVWSRTESIRGHCKRHQMFITARWGATRQGKLTAAEVRIIQDAGAYAYTSSVVLGCCLPVSTGVYEIPNVSVDGYAVYTNNIPGGAFRGFGSPQGAFVAERQMDKLANALDMDPVELRECNLLKKDSLLSVSTPLPSELQLNQMLTECAQMIGWSRRNGNWQRPAPMPAIETFKKRGVGLAIGFKNVGLMQGFPDESSAVIELHGETNIESAVVYFAGAECGQGVLTAISQIAADALGLPPEKIQLINADTAKSPEAGTASASRLTLVGGNAVIGAAEAALEEWWDENRPAIGTYTFRSPPTTDYAPDTGVSMPGYSYSPIAQAAEVEVDTQTGHLRILRFVTVVDVGKAVNPKMIEGQVEGAVAQGVGYAVTENFVTENCEAKTTDLTTYLIPTVLDLPEKNEIIILENPDPAGHWGVRGLAEAPLLGVAPAIASAIYDAVGIEMDRLPFTQESIVAKLLKATR